MSGTWKVGIDIGGTFTDVIAINAAGGEVRTAKVQSQTSDPIASIVSAYNAIDVCWDGVSDLMHGTTMATNAIVEGNLAPVALIATEGFRDTIEIGRQNRRELYHLDVTPKLPPLVPEQRRVEAGERIGPEGQILKPLCEDEVNRVAGVIDDLNVEAVALALQHCYVNADHEKMLGDRLTGTVKYVALSHEMSPEPREFERTNTTILNAALMPLTAGYLDKLQAGAGDTTNIHLFHSAGGMASIDAVKERPLTLALSGPAAGVAAAGKIAGELNLDNAIGFDMGGTTTDTSVVIDGKVQVGSDQRLAGRPVRQLMVAVESIGAGGGSIARVEGAAVRVGPDSAGAQPGPACYGLGGARPTVTDANMTLGFLNPDRLLGGVIRLSKEKAEAAVKTLSDAFGTSVHETAIGIYRVANASMARALRRVTVERGVDARSCSLIAFGGAGPMHAVALAREFGINRVVVPKFSSVFSALGCLTAELSYAEQHTVRMSSTDWDSGQLDARCQSMKDRLSAPIVAAGHDANMIAIRYIALIRYAGQSDTVEVPFDLPCDEEKLGRDFMAQHKKLYGFATDEPWQFETLRITVTAPSQSHIADLNEIAAVETTTPISVNECWFDAIGSVPTRRFERGALPTDWKIDGPSIIEDDWSTIVVPPGATAWIDPSGHLIIEAGMD
ncbi:MAG: hydantoinase/oxoprolinase family protein [Rhodospirillales bacterium]|jgi:N-methylhydantoinase A|nr:hydantoinase/oxoprolinase family protein [Rhodospirillales bacterium]MBT4628144.1 hydantoinase/oxoprolinase family protein [Rhodospirillales bacterium]MBT5353101.1 hydantoinase/oxoprolinase family protein [Rhodospirillales bacterium]MBT5520788.1 hydantoinase/oxoprolinase family protein [Rhodospirillales bacterium]MBT6108762.1 hydantoinase/oxoprolinase family protein [Rhodospirillales bacterium]